jgi:integrase
MRRKRFMKGSVRPRKHGKLKVWVAQWWEDGHRRSKVLGRCSEMTKGQAEVVLNEIVAPLNRTAGHNYVGVYTFGTYLEKVFLPANRGKWKDSTRMTTEDRMLFHLKPEFGERLLRNITREEMQSFLDVKARRYSRSVVGHLRWDLNSVFKMARSDGYVEYNPATALFTPGCKPDAEKKVMSKEQIRVALNALNLRERLVFRMAVFDGMRPVEILAIRLEGIGTKEVHIKQRVYRGTLDTLKGRKGKRTERVVALSPGTLADLKEWKSTLTDQTPSALLFPTERGTLLSRDNFWRRSLQPALEKVHRMGKFSRSAADER